MGTIIWLAIVVIIIFNVIGKSQSSQKSNQQRRQQMNTAGSYSQQQDGARQANVYRAPQQQGAQQNMYRTPSQQGAQQRVVTDADRAKLEAYRQKKAGTNAYVPSKPTEPKQNPDANRQRSAAQPNIVERAKENSRKYANRDETLSELESQHRHSERVGSAVADYVEKEREEHRRMHEEPIPRVEDVSLLGSVEDLMIKGYDGNLSFERDFIGEAADMLVSFTLPD